MEGCFALFVLLSKYIASLLELPLKEVFRICLENTLTTRTQIQLCAEHTTLRPPITLYDGHGILTMCPSGAAFAIPLGPTNPSLIVIAKETLIFRRAGISPALWLLVPTFLLRNAPPWLTPLASTQMRILSYRWYHTIPTLSFGTTLEPRLFAARVL